MRPTGFVATVELQDVAKKHLTRSYYMLCWGVRAFGTTMNRSAINRVVFMMDPFDTVVAGSFNRGIRNNASLACDRFRRFELW